MPEIDYATREARLKFLIVGPAGAGKTTLLRALHAKLPANERTAIVESKNGSATARSFDFAIVDLLPLAEYRARGTIATVTTRPTETAAFARACGEVDALLFVADSDPTRVQDNMTELNHLAGVRHLRDVPLVYFYNKRDLGLALPITELETRLNPLRAAHHGGAAIKGEGLDGVLRELTRVTLANSG